MNHHASPTPSRLGGSLIGALAAFCLAVPALAIPAERPAEKAEEKHEAEERVARKVEKARQKAREAEREPLEADRRAIRDFHERVAKYAKLRARELSRLGKPAVADAEASAAAQKALARAIQSKRVKARQGDIFTRAVVPVFRRLVATELQGPDALAARKAVIEGNPKHEEPKVALELRVNAEYPLGSPRSTVPPSLLMTLPPLPECLHYRFVGRDLILVDSVAQIIVDFLPGGAPVLEAR